MTSNIMTRFTLPILWKQLAMLGILLSGIAQGQDKSTQQPNLPTISQVHGVDLRMDSILANAGASTGNSPLSISSPGSMLQQVWNALQPNGFDLLRIPLDVRDANGAADRAISLCSWAKDNNVKLIFVLTGSDAGQRLSRDYPKAMAEFAKALVARFRTGGDQTLPAYAQILAFQIESELNHPGKHGGEVPPASLALDAAKLLRKTQEDALNGTGVQSAPLVVSASFDFPLIQAGAIANVALTEAAYNKAYKNLQGFLAALAASADVDVLAVDWFAGSISAGNADRFPQLLEKLMADLPGKRVIFSSGFSSAGSTPEQQQTFAAGFSQLTNFCMNRGSECRFMGAIFHEAVNGQVTVLDSQSTPISADWQTWNWPSKAAELAAMWTNKKKSDTLPLWLAAVENSMGLVSLQMDSSQATLPTQTTAPAADVPSGVPSGVFNGRQQPINSGANTTPDPGAQAVCPPPPDPSQGLVSRQAAPANCQSSASEFKTVAISVIGKMMSQLADQLVQRMAPKSQPVNVATGAVYPNADPALNTSIAPQTGISPPAYGSNPATNYNLPSAMPPVSQAGNTMVGSGDGSGTQPASGTPGAVDSSQPSAQAANTAIQPQPSTTTQPQPSSTGTRTVIRPNISVVIVRPGPQSAQAGNAPAQSSTPAASPTPASASRANSAASTLPPVDRRPQPSGNPASSFPQNANGGRPTPATTANVIVPPLPPVDRRPQPPVQPNSNLVTKRNLNQVPGGVDLSVSSSRLNVVPAQPRAGQPVTFTVDVTNLGIQPPQRASATFVLFAGSRQFQQSVVPFTIGGRNATSQVRWPTTLPPEAGPMSVKITVNDDGDTNLANNSLTFQFSVAKR